MLGLGVDSFDELERSALLPLCKLLFIFDICFDHAIIGKVLHGTVSLTYQSCWWLVESPSQLVVERGGVVGILVLNRMPQGWRLADT